MTRGTVEQLAVVEVLEFENPRDPSRDRGCTDVWRAVDSR